MTDALGSQPWTITFTIAPASAPTKYKITMSNGGKAKVDGTVVTEAAAGATVTIVADKPVSGTEFNGWTTTTEGVTFANANAATTTFTMPASNVTITASYQESAPSPSRPSYTPSYTPSTTTTTTTTTETKTEEKMTFEGETTLSNTDNLSWSGITGAKSYTLSVEVDGEYVELATTTGTNIDVIHGADGNYYVSEGGRYTKYVYEDGKFVKDGTISVSKADKLTKANDVTDNFLLQYTDESGKISSVENSLTTSVNVYYKPAVKASVKDDKAKLSWKKVTGATKYAVYKVRKDGSLKLLKKKKNAKINVTDLKSGKTYRFAVKAYVDGKWTKVKTSDVVKVKVK